MINFNIVRNKLMSIKLCMARSVSYITMINSAMILFLFLSKLKESGFIEFDLGKYFFPILIGGFVALTIFGWIEMYKFKGASKEMEFGFRLSPPLVEMSDKIKKIESKLDILLVQASKTQSSANANGEDLNKGGAL